MIKINKEKQIMFPVRLVKSMVQGECHLDSDGHP